jgi:hypothetical protein
MNFVLFSNAILLTLLSLVLGQEEEEPMNVFFKPLEPCSSSGMVSQLKLLKCINYCSLVDSYNISLLD